MLQYAIPTKNIDNVKRICVIKLKKFKLIIKASLLKLKLGIVTDKSIVKLSVEKIKNPTS